MNAAGMDLASRASGSQRPLTVALMIESDGPGGAEFVLVHLAEELRRRGHLVLPIGPAVGYGWLAEQLTDRGFEPASFHLRAPLDPICLLELVRLLRSRRVDVLHAHEFTMAVYGAASAMLLRRPQIVTMHGGMYFAGKRRRRTALRWACGRSDYVVAVSEASRVAFAEAAGLDRETISVVPNGIPLREGEGGRVTSELALRHGEVLILAVGNLYPVKGHGILLRALAELREARPDLAWRLAIAGRGKEEEDLRLLADRKGIADRVHLLGYRDDIASLLAAADVFVMPSLSEGLPLAILEAMFSGRAILASSVGGIPEVLEEGHDALLVPPGEVTPLVHGLAKLIEDRSLRARLGEAAASRARAQYSVAAMTDAYETMYRKVTAGD